MTGPEAAAACVPVRGPCIKNTIGFAYCISEGILYAFPDGRVRKDRVITMEQPKKLSVSRLRKMKQEGKKIVMLTAYDYRTAQLAAACGVDMLLVGDSLGMCVMGYPNTIPVTMEDCLHHCKMVRRGAPETFVVGDMPFLSIQTSDRDALINAGRFMQEAFCDAVKIEADAALAPVAQKMVHAGIPVMGHIGLQPQHVVTAGGYKVPGKTVEDAQRILADAKALEQAGVFAIVLECVPASLAEEITKSVSVPTIGIGAGAGCDGQVQVVYDILGLFPGPLPRHAKKYTDLTGEITKAMCAYADEVRNGAFPEKEHSF